jgi:hypothetical protein
MSHQKGTNEIAILYGYYLSVENMKYCVVTFLILNSCHNINTDRITTTYYLNIAGSDSNSGTKDSPFLSVERLNSIKFGPGDTIFLESGQSFEGTLRLDSGDRGTNGNPIVVTSTSNHRPTRS